MATRPRRKHTPSRNQLFKAALAYFGETRESWGKANNTTVSYLAQVQGGFKKSPRIAKLVDQTIALFLEAVTEDAQVAA